MDRKWLKNDLRSYGAAALCGLLAGVGTRLTDFFPAAGEEGGVWRFLCVWRGLPAGLALRMKTGRLWLCGIGKEGG